MPSQNVTDILPDTPEEQADKETLVEAYKASNPPMNGTWVGIGDTTLEYHGHTWYTFNPDYLTWNLVTTTHVDDVFVDEDGLSYDDPGEQFCKEGSVGVDEVITPAGEWTDEMRRYLNEIGKDNVTPVGAIVDGELTELIVQYGADNKTSVDPVQDETNEFPDGTVVRDSYSAVLEYLIGHDPQSTDE